MWVCQSPTSVCVNAMYDSFCLCWFNKTKADLTPSGITTIRFMGWWWWRLWVYSLEYKNKQKCVLVKDEKNSAGIKHWNYHITCAFGTLLIFAIRKGILFLLDIFSCSLISFWLITSIWLEIPKFWRKKKEKLNAGIVFSIALRKYCLLSLKKLFFFIWGIV